MNVRKMVQCALFAALLALCAWISIPAGEIAFTLQTFGICLTLELLGGRRGSAAIAVYLAMGAVGLPVFTGFRGGIGMLLGTTGGYLAGFLATGLIYWLITALFGGRPWARLLGLVLGLLTCYGIGTIWFSRVYLQGGHTMTLAAVLAKCVLPYLLPDGIKLWLAWILSRRLRILKEFSA